MLFNLQFEIYNFLFCNKNMLVKRARIRKRG
jgi:hypothetical protein